MDDLDSIIAKITALFSDYLIYDISEQEWARVQRRLAAIILAVQNTPKMPN